MVAGKEAGLVHHFQVIAQRAARHRQHIQIQIIAQIPLHQRNTAREPQHLGDILAARLDVGQVRDFIIDAIEQLRF